ncbi:DivIVA domain-containing protein [Mycoplasmopsis verecunda]|uniref:DivIVA domain-containing protein n=1 Tax=Mycoplasmopsis verecunda TaxID=171291 RepID=A0A1T4KMQ8_9BACT|nr:DivIVA domain-containing protein [Mycoplasmopsis verecunda]WPB54302.1 DivIVA domain-containing protein [Mycoplasmopsis verecunda]SJZ43680.1 DivIVA domain-containing protein [Mycoplasmopsis verecunda]
MEDKYKILSELIKNKKFNLNLEGYNKSEVDDFLQFIFTNLLDGENEIKRLQQQLDEYKDLYLEELKKNQMLEEENNRLSKEVEKIYE